LIFRFRKRRALLLTLPVLIFCCVFVLFHEVKGEGAMETVTVVTYNVGTLNGEKPSLERVVSAIGKKGAPDLLLLQEVPDEAFALRIAGKLRLPYHAFGAYSANGSGYGLAVLSSRPLVNPAMHLLKPYGHSVLTAEMRSEKNRVLVCSAHLERVRTVKQNKEGFELPWEKAFQILKTELTNETPRSHAVEEILLLLALRRSEETIIGGDFNTVPFSTAIRGMERVYSDALWLTTDYFTGTYIKVGFFLKPRIDYIFHSVGMKVREASVIRQGAGDHYPVWAVLGAHSG